MSPAHSRVFSDGQTTKASLRATSLPQGAATATFRRVTRAGGHASRVSRLSSVSRSTKSLRALGLFDTNSLPESETPVASVLGAELPTPGITGICTTDILHHRSTVKPSGGRSIISAKGDLSGFDTDVRAAENAAMDLTNVALPFSRIDPGSAILSRIQSRCSYTLNNRADPLDPILAAPEFPQAMYSYLRDVAGDWFVPGLENVLDDTVTLLEANSGAIEAYMVGLSHEMGRELLWREFPTDQRGTYFKQFWDPASNYTASSLSTGHHRYRSHSPLERLTGREHTDRL